MVRAEIDDGDRTVKMAALLGSAYITLIREARAAGKLHEAATGSLPACMLRCSLLLALSLHQSYLVVFRAASDDVLCVHGFARNTCASMRWMMNKSVPWLHVWPAVKHWREMLDYAIKLGQEDIEEELEHKWRDPLRVSITILLHRPARCCV